MHPNFTCKYKFHVVEYYRAFGDFKEICTNFFDLELNRLVSLLIIVALHVNPIDDFAFIETVRHYNIHVFGHKISSTIFLYLDKMPELKI